MNIEVIPMPDRLKATIVTRTDIRFCNFGEEKLQMTKIEKKWLFQEVLLQNGVRDGELDFQLTTKKGLIKCYGLHTGFFKQSSFTNYVKFGDLNLKGQHSYEVLPHHLESIKTKVALAEHSNTVVSISEFRGLLLQAAFESAQERKCPKKKIFYRKDSERNE